MALIVGPRLRPHDVAAPLDAGGILDEYRATDTSCERTYRRLAVDRSKRRD
jgi:hypothetical protein